MNYLVNIPQSKTGIEALITSEQRDEYLKRLEEFDEDLTIDYSDDSEGNEEFYDFDREIDTFSVKDAKACLNNAEESEEVEAEILAKHKWIKRTYEQMMSNKTWIDDWFEAFTTIRNNKKWIDKLCESYEKTKQCSK